MTPEDLIGADDVAHTEKHPGERLPEYLMRRAEALAAAVRLSTAEVARMALERGLDSLEEELGGAGETSAAEDWREYNAMIAEGMDDDY